LQDEHGYTPLHWATTSFETPEIALNLIQAGAKLDSKSIFDRTPLDYANENFKKKFYAEIKKKQKAR